MSPVTDVVPDLLLKATMVFGAGWIATRVMSRASAASRHAVWAAVCVAALLLPVTRSLMPTMAVPWWPVAHTRDVVTVAVNTTVNQESAPAVAVGDTKPGWVSRTWVPWMLVLWLSGIVVVLARLWIGRRATQALERRSTPFDDVRIATRADVVSGWFGGTRLQVLEGPADSMPATWGVSEPVLVLPPSARDWSDTRLETVLVHELAHVRRRDAWWQQLAQVTAAVWWMHPLAWLMVREMRVERECACDDLVLAFGARATDYATDLVVMVGECGDAAMDATATLAMARRSQLEGRVMAILNPNVNRDGRTRVASVLAGVLVLAMIPLAALRASDRDESISPAASQAPRVGSQIAEPRKVHHVAPVYPEIARTAKVEGIVVIEVAVDADGAVTDAKVLRPVALLDQAAVDAVRQWRFTRTMLNGEAVPVVMTVTVSFKLDADGNPVAPPPPTPAPPAGEQPRASAPPVPPPPPVEWDGVSPLRIGGSVKEPKKVKHVNPVYPPIAQSANVQGIVIIEALIDPDGRVESARVIRPVALLDQAALDAVLQWEFEPTYLNGRPVPVLMTVTVNFTLQ